MKAFWIGGAVAAAIGIATLTGVAVAQHTGPGGHAMQSSWGGGGWGGRAGAGMMRDPARMFALVDANGDGFIDRDELTNMRWRFVQALDADNDGVITRQEAEANVARWRDAMRTSFGDGFGGWGGGGQGRGVLMWLSRQDTTGSGRVTRQQLAADPAPLMRLLDRDTDGRISRAELDVFVEAMRSMRPNRT